MSTEGRAAISKVQYALRRGLLAKLPCARCGSTKRIQAHHKDYCKPLHVTWLCLDCHCGLHADQRKRSKRAAIIAKFTGPVMGWITLAEAAAELGISPQRVSQLAKAKCFRSKRHSLARSKIVLVYVFRPDVLARKANPPAPHRPKSEAAPA